MDDYVTVYFIMIIIIGFIGLVSNIVVIIVYIFDKKLRSFTNYFFVNLSICDILIVVFCLPVGLMDMYNEGTWVLGEFICRVELFVESVFLSVSSLTLISISLGRFFATKYPLNLVLVEAYVRVISSRKVMENKFSTKRTTLLVIAGVWLMSMLLSSPMYHFTTFGSDNRTGETIEYCYIQRATIVSKLYVSTFVGLILFAPTLILTFVYVGIIRNLRRLNKSYSVQSTAANNLLNSRHHRRPLNYEIVFRSKANSTNNVNTNGVAANVSPNNGADRDRDPSIRIILMNRTRGGCGDPNRGPVDSRATVNPADVNGAIDPKISYEEIKRSFCTNNLIKKRRQTIILCTVAMTFFFCQIPVKLFQIFNTFYEMSPGENDTQEQMSQRFKILNIIFLTAKLIYCFHSMSNPIIYNLMSSKFSRSYRKVLLCKSLSGSYSKPNYLKNNNHHAVADKLCFNRRVNRRDRPQSFYELKTNNSSMRKETTLLMTPAVSLNHSQTNEIRNNLVYD